MEVTTRPVRGGMFNVEVLRGGSGSPVLFLHGAMGLNWDGFLDQLATRHTVVAPFIPGYGGTSGDEHLLDFHDLITFFLDFLDAEGLRNLPIIGHSIGGMIAAELAAVQPDRFTKLVLIAPTGLWDPANPVLDFFVASPTDLAQALYYDQDSEPAKRAAYTPEDAEGRVAVALERVKSLRVAAKYLWPIPNRGLNKRIHRISAPTLIVWGANDLLNPPSYAQAFSAKIPGSRVQLIPNAAHQVQEERPRAVAEAVLPFIA